MFLIATSSRFFTFFKTSANTLKNTADERNTSLIFVDHQSINLRVRAQFEEIFGNDDFCAILVEADNVFAPAILSGIRALGQELMAKVPFADDVVSLTDFEFILGTDEGMAWRLSTWCPGSSRHLRMNFPGSGN